MSKIITKTNENNVISKQILQFFNTKPLNLYKNENRTEASLRFIKENQCLNWNEINKTFEWNEIPDDKFEEIIFSHEKCVQKIPSFQLILQEIQLYKTRVPLKNFYINVKELCTWTYRLDDLDNLLKLEESFKSKNIIRVLVLTSILEYSLGNVFFSKRNQKPPHLLKLLLRSTELNEIFKEAMRLVRYLLGTPVSVNLRNLVWHGFPSLELIDEVFSYLLLLIISSFGLILTELNFKIVLRPLKIVSVKEFEEISLILFKNLDIKTYIEIITNTESILGCYKNIWTDIVVFGFTHELFGLATILLLPQLEMMLRNIYGRLNNWDTTAKIDEYYITMDNVVEDFTVGRPEEKNNLKIKLDDTSLCLFYDLFSALNGPRIRDRVSHGEVAFTQLDRHIFQLLLLFGLRITEKFTISNSHEMKIPDFSYDSNFHPVSQLKNNFQGLKILIETLNEFQFPNELTRMPVFKENIQKEELLLPNFNLITYIRQGCEPEIVFILIKILENCITAVKNFSRSLTVRLEEYVAHKLSTARRKTFIKTVENFYKIFHGLELQFKICIKAVEHEWIKFESNFQQKMKLKRVKILRKTLKTAENYSKYLKIENNDWSSACKDCEYLENIYNSLK